MKGMMMAAMRMTSAITMPMVLMSDVAAVVLVG